MILYLPYEESMCTDECGAYITFGIDAYDGNGHEIAAVPDVSVSRPLVASLCDTFTKQQVDPIHLHDVIEDAL